MAAGRIGEAEFVGCVRRQDGAKEEGDQELFHENRGGCEGH